MPNHFHGIILIHDMPGRGGSRTAPTTNAVHEPSERPGRKPLGRLVGVFKTVSTKHINLRRNRPAVPVWQRNYYEHIIRNERSLNHIREYILNNPLQWEIDRENPLRPTSPTTKVLAPCET